MGTHLNSKGDLTISQREHAEAMGMKPEEFRQQITERLMEMRGGRVPTTRPAYMKKNSILAKNPVLIVGGGPSARMNLEAIKRFPGKVVLVEIMFNEFAKKGLIPDYVMTLEENKKIINPELFDPKYLKDTIVVGSSITRGHIAKHVNKYGTFERFTYHDEPRASNCGIFAICYAKEYLKADKIVLVGMEHTGMTYPPATYHTWQTDFWYFAKQWPKETIVNCSGGLLYHEDYIIDAELDKLRING